jgi:hypothetical protein
MPIEIREIVIRATVNQGDASVAPNATPPASSSPPDVLQECIDQVVQVLKDKNER